MVTASGGGVSRGWPRQGLLAALLIVSVVLNLFFIAGAVWTRWQPPVEATGTAEHYRQLAGELDLDPGQRAAFDRYVAAMRSRGTAVHQQVLGLIGGIWNELEKPQADTKQLQRLLDEIAEKRRESVQEAMMQTLDFMSVLSPAQRSKFVAASRERHPHWRPAPKSH